MARRDLHLHLLLSLLLLLLLPAAYAQDASATDALLFAANQDGYTGGQIYAYSFKTNEYSPFLPLPSRKRKKKRGKEKGEKNII